MQRWLFYYLPLIVIGYLASSTYLCYHPSYLQRWQGLYVPLLESCTEDQYVHNPRGCDSTSWEWFCWTYILLLGVIGNLFHYHYDEKECHSWIPAQVLGQFDWQGA